MGAMRLNSKTIVALTWIMNACVSPATADCIDPPSELVSWWPGDGNALDIVGSNNGTRQGGAYFAQARVGKGFAFDSNDDGVTVNHNSNLDVQATGFTADFWVKGVKNQPGSIVTLFEKSHGATDFTGWAFHLSSATGIPSFAIGDGAGFPQAFGTSDVLDGSSHLLTGVWEAGTILLYVDGVLQGTAANATPANNTRRVNLGFFWGGGTPDRFFRGTLDELEIFERALTAAEIMALHDAGRDGKCKPPVTPCTQAPLGLVSWWPGDGGATDIVGGRNGTLSGGAYFAAGEVKEGFAFDSDDDGVTIAHDPALDVQASGFTADFWMKGVKNQPEAFSAIFEKSHGFGDFTGWVFHVRGATGIPSFTISDGAAFPGVDGSVDVLDGNFHLIAGVWNSGMIRLYVDGVLQGLAPNATPANNTRSVNVGYAWGGGTRIRHFRGVADELEVFNRALSAADIQRIYAAGPAGKCKPGQTEVAENQTEWRAMLRPVVPNPARQSMSVEFNLPDSRSASLSLFDINGRRVFSREVGSLGRGWHRIAIGERSKLPVGLYMLRLIQGDQSLSTRVVVVR